MSDLVLIFFSACLVNNLVLDQLIGVCPAVALSRRLDVAALTAMATMAVTAIAAPLGWLLRTRILDPLGVPFLELIALVALIASVMHGIGAIARHRYPDAAGRIEAITPLLLANCTVLGVVLQALAKTHGFAAALFHGLGAGAGFALVLSLLFALQDRAAAADVPAAFRGAPITLLTLALLSMAFMGFTGLTGL